MTAESIRKTQLNYSILTFVSTAFWGLYWLPLRKIEETGVSAAWSVFAIYLIPLVFLLPLFIIRRRTLLKNRGSLCLIGLTVGAALSCYATAFLHTSVLRTIMLFYMMPIWSTLLSIVLLDEKINVRRWIAVATGLTGLAVMLFNPDDSESHLFATGELIALLSGVFWGLGTVLIRKSPQIDATDIVPIQYLFAMLISAIFLVAANNSNALATPELSSWLRAMPYIIGFYIVIILPTIFICIKASQVLSPGRVGILMMSEVLVAGISAPLIAGETLSGREWLAAIMIIMAAIIEVTTPGSTTEES